MKRSIFTILLFCFALSLANAQEITVPQTQRPLLTKRTASWCPLCGGWGWTFFRNLLDDNQNKAVFFAAHFDGAHTTPTSTAITGNFGGVSQPVFFLNNQNQGVTSANTATARTNIQNQVNAAYASAPVVQSGIRPVLNSASNALSVQAKARFFQNATGEYYLGIYLVHKEFIGFQSGQGNSAEHKEMVFAHLTPTPFGEQIGNGAINAGTEVAINGEISVAGLDASKLRVVTIVWKKEGAIYQVVNSNEEDEFLEPSSTAEPTAQYSVRVFPNVISQEGRVELTLTATATLPWRIELISTSGQVVETLFAEVPYSGTHQFALRKGNHPAGLYFLRLTDGVLVHTERVVLK